MSDPTEGQIAVADTNNPTPDRSVLFPGMVGLSTGEEQIDTFEVSAEEYQLLLEIKGISAERRQRIREVAQIENLIKNSPALSDDPETDNKLKGDIAEQINTVFTTEMDLAKLIELIISHTYDYRIETRRLMAFLQSENVVRLMIDNIFKYFSTRPQRGSKIKREVESSEEVQQKLEGFLEYIEENYDPYISNRTIAKYIAHIQRKIYEEYGDYNVLEWFQRPEIRQRLIRKVSDQIEHIVNTESVKNARTRAGNSENSNDQNLKTFIEIYRSMFFYRESGRIVFDLERFREFFLYTVPKIQNEYKLTNSDLREYLKATCRYYFERSRTLMMRVITGRSQVQEIPFTGLDNALDFIDQKIEENTQILTINNGSNNFLSDPRNIHPHHAYFYSACQSEGGMDRAIAEQELKKMFPHIQNFEEISAELQRVLTTAQGYLKYLEETMSFDKNETICKSKKIRECMDYPELIRIAIEGTEEAGEAPIDENQQKINRFEARRKLELASMILDCENERIMVYLQDDIARINEHLFGIRQEFSENGNAYTIVKIDTERDIPLKIEEGNRYVLFFEDDIETGPRLLKSVSVPAHSNINDEIEALSRVTNPDNIKVVELIPASFSGTKCWLMNKDGRILREKSMYSILTKLIRSEVDADQITDLIGMTIVVDDEASYEEIKRKIDLYYANLFKSKGSENRYQAEVEDVRVRPNIAKSCKYQAYKKKIAIPVKLGSRKKMKINTEIRVFRKFKNLFEELSSHHDASHERYVIRRNNPVIHIVAPRSLYPYVYGHAKRDPRDPFNEPQTVPKTPLINK